MFDNLTKEQKSNIEFLRATFKDDHESLKVVRKMVLGIEMSDKEKSIADTLKGQTKFVSYLRDSLTPTITGNENVHGVKDMWFQLSIKDKSENDAIVLMHVVAATEKYLTDAIADIENEGTNKKHIDALKFDSTKTDKVNLINTLSRSVIVSALENTLKFMEMVSGKETIEELAERMAKNSTK